MMGKTLLHTFSGLQVAWIRYFGGFFAFGLFAFLSVLFGREKKWSDFFLFPKQSRTWFDLLALGVGPFVFSPILQFIGLESAQAMDNSILIATEPLITVILAWAVLGEKMTRDHFISMGGAIFGFFLFAGFFENWGEGVTKVTFSFGMVLLVLSQFGEAGFSVFSRKLVLVHSPTAVLGTALLIGATVLTFVVATFDSLPIGGNPTWIEVGAGAWLGPIGSTLTYFIWARIAQTVTVAPMVITLFVQPIVGTAVGYFLLGESLTASRAFGALLILAAIAYLSFREVRRAPVV
jgi:drug/metabolite transporter (DMT)-like permease